MTTIANRPAARWLPSRSHFAIFRLIGFLCSRRACEEPPQPGILAVNSEQNMFEQYSVSVFSMLTIAWYTTIALEHLLMLPVAIVVSVAFAPLVVQVPLYITGGALVPLLRGRRGTNNLRISTATVMGFLFALAAFFSVRGGSLRYLAMAWLTVGCLNALAAVVLFFLKSRVRSLESRCGA